MWNNINLLVTYCKVVELGSFTKAADFLHQPKSRISRSITSLENAMNLHLINRTTRSFSLTDDGKQLYDRISPLLSEMSSELNRIESKSDEISGSLKISAPEDIGQYLLVDLLSEYQKVFPKVSVQLHLSNHYVDFTTENIDVAFRVGNLKDSSLIHKKLAKVQLIFVAATSYINQFGSPKNIEDLEKHKVIYFMNKNKLEPSKLFGKSSEAKFASSSFAYIYKAIRQGHGVGLVPEFFCTEDLRAGNLQRILTQVTVPHSTLQIVYPQSKNVPMKTKSFIDFAAKKIKFPS